MGTATTPYQALIDFLATQQGETLALTFDEIERVLGDCLPLRARSHTDQWSNPRRVHIRMLRASGWRARLDHANRCVRFVRDAAPE